MSALIDIIGYVGKPAEVRTGRDSSDKFVTFDVSSFNPRNKKTTWYRATFFRRDERFAEMLTSGKHVFITGEFEPEVREVNGKTYVNNNVVGTKVIFLDKKSDVAATDGSPRNPDPRPKGPIADDFSGAPAQDDDIPFLPPWSSTRTGTLSSTSTALSRVSSQVRTFLSKPGLGSMNTTETTWRPKLTKLAAKRPLTG